MPILPMKFRLLLFSSLLITFFIIPSPTLASGVTYYVATYGNDNNSGSENDPWRTLEHATDEAGSGDTIYVRSGTYYPTKSIQLSIDNPPDSPILLMPYPGETVIIDGSRTAPENDIFVVRGEYYEIRGFELRNSKRVGINLYTGNHIRVINNIIHDSQKDAINGSVGTSDLYVAGNTVYHNVHENDRFQMNHEGGWAAAIRTTENGDIIINNIIYENWGEGIGANGTNHFITGNTLRDNYSVEIYADNLAESTINGNFVYTTNDPSFMRLYPSGVTASATGISMANEDPNNPVRLNHLKITNNIVVGNRHWSISQWESSRTGGLRNSIIANNTFVTNNVSGIIRLDDVYQENTTIANNIFYQRNPDTVVALISNLNGIVFKNNHWYGENRIFSTIGDSAEDAHDLYSEPSLVNPDGTSPEDFRLVPGSPDINAGCSVNGVAADFWGQNRLAPYDIGAYESDPASNFIFLPWLTSK